MHTHTIQAIAETNKPYEYREERRRKRMGHLEQEITPFGLFVQWYCYVHVLVLVQHKT